MASRIDNRRGERGVILLASLIAVVIVAALSAALFGTAQAEMQSSQNYRIKSQILHLAEAATATAEQQIIAAVANSLAVPPNGTVTLGPNVVNFTINQLGGDTTTVDASGVQTITRNYQIDSVATMRGYSKTVHRVVQVGMTPIFQFAIFYDKDLELLPGPNMTLSGRVHANQDIFVGVGGSSTLTINSDYFRAVGNIYRRRKDVTGSLTSGVVRIREKTSALFQPMFSQFNLAGYGIPSTSGFDSDFTGWDSNGDGDISDPTDWVDFAVGALTLWKGTVQTAAHGMKRIEPPSIGSIKRFESVNPGQGDYQLVAGTYQFVGAGNGDHRKGRYHASADLIIRDGVAYNNAGGLIALPPGTLSEVSFYEGREKKAVKVTQIDMSLLNIAGFPANGLIYASRSDTTTAAPNGIRLTNGSLLAAPLTVVSEDPVYVHGDFNTVNKKPAAVIADAVNLLSNSWDDSKVKGTLPVATETTYNMALITGGPETTPDVDYSGGFENLPRFHEDWKNVDANILGSFVKTYGSDFAQGKWVYGSDRYTAPDRNWDYDVSFNNAANLPPFTPNVAQVKNEGWWE